MHSANIQVTVLNVVEFSGLFNSQIIDHIIGTAFAFGNRRSRVNTCSRRYTQT